MKALSPNLLGAVALLGAALGLVWQGQPGLAEKWQYMAPDYEQRLTQREVYIDPAELLHLMNDDYVDLRIWDVRSESDWNQFHLADAERVPLSALPAQRDRMRELSAVSVLVFVGNDEQVATRAWKHAMALAKPNAYILEGGLNLWLDVYGVHEEEESGHGLASPTPDGTLRHPFKRALGGRHAASRPDEHYTPHREYRPKVILLKKVAKSRGCG